MLYLYSLFMWIFGFIVKICFFISIRSGFVRKINNLINDFFGISLLDKPSIWVHASSLGEARLVFNLTYFLLENFSHKYTIVVTSTTESSHELWNKKFENEISKRLLIKTYLPFDTRSNVRKFISKFNPKLVLWVESDFWPNCLLAIKKAKIDCILLNGRISHRSFARWKLFYRLANKILSAFTFIFADSEQSLRNIGFFLDKNNDDYENKIVYKGNLKYLSVSKVCERDRECLAVEINNRPTVLYVSTHEKEELMAANIHHQLKKNIPNLLSIVIPRHIERSGAIIKILTHQKYNFRISRLSDGPLNSGTEILIVDEFSKVGLFCSVIHLVYIGKSMFVNKGGGHNLVEPMSFGCRVVFGPYMYNFSEIVNQALELGLVAQVKTPFDLLSFFAKYLQSSNNPEFSNKVIQFTHLYGGVHHEVQNKIKHILATQDGMP